MQLSPEIMIFLGIAAVALLMISGLGVATMFGLYNVDRSVQAVTSAPQTKRKKEEPETRPVSLSAQSRYVLARGQVEVGPSLGLKHGKLGMWMFLASEVMFFTALIGAYLAFRISGQAVVPTEDMNLPLAALNTFLLIVSSFTVVLAFDAIEDGDQSRFIAFLLASLALGTIFVGIQAVEWTELLNHGVTPDSSLFGTTFYVLTGFHGLHVIIGLLWLAFVLLKAFRGDFSQHNNVGVETFGLYWHFVDIVWIILFTIIYLL